MTDLSPPNLKRLLDEAAPGPWEYVPGEALDERCIVNLDTTTPCIAIVADEAGSDCTDADLTLAAAAPELAQEVLRLRAGVEQLLEMCLLERDAAFQDSPMRAGEVVAFNLCAERLTDLLDAHNLGDQDG